MSDHPREIHPDDASPRLLSLIRDLTIRLLNGPSPEHRALRDQFERARLGTITLTGAGLYADFVHEILRPVSPPEWIGGDVEIRVEGLDAPAGCLVKISDGQLDFLEVYTFGEVPWPDDPIVIDLGEAQPVPVPSSTPL